MLTVTLLGTAATLPKPDRALSSAVFSAFGRSILLDCGEGTQLALHRHHMNPMHIDLVALTHYHGDHILGLPGLLQTLGTMERTQPLYITGPEEGHTAIIAAILTLADELPYPVEFLPMPAEGMSLHTLHPKWPPETTLTAITTEHRIPSQGYRLHLSRMRRLYADKAAAMGIPKRMWQLLQGGQSITLDGQVIHPHQVCGAERPGLSVVFTGDTTACPSLREAAENADLLIMDATYAQDEHADKAALWGHATFSQAAEIARSAGAKRLWLTHYSARITEPEEHLPVARRIFPAAECGTDGKSILLTFREHEM